MNKDLMQMTVGAVEKELRKHGSQFLNYRRINHGVLKDVKGSVKVGKVSSVKGAFSELNAKGALNYRGVIGAFNKRASLNDIYGQINITVKQFRKLTQDILGDHDKNLQVARVLMRNGWVTSEFIYNDILKMNYNKSEKEILSYIKKFYSKNNYQKFFRIFDLIIDGFQEFGMNEGYRSQLIRIKEIIGQNLSNYDLFINDLFSIAEYVCAFQFGMLSNNDYINKNSIKANRRKYADKNGQLTAIDLLSFFTVLKDWWEKANFKVGLDQTAFSRNTVEHGRFDPRRYQKIDFIKIVVFIFNAMMSPNLRDK